MRFLRAGKEGKPLARALAALALVQATFALYTVVTKTALNGGLDPGVYVVLRDSTTAAVQTGVLHATLRTREASQSMVEARTRHDMLRPATDGDALKFWALGALGLYFGQYFTILGLQHGSSVLAATWSNTVPAVTYMLGLGLGEERVRLHEWPSVLKVLGVILGVGGAIVATVGADSEGSHEEGGGGRGSAPLACVFFGFQVFFGGAVFWHLQKQLLLRYTPVQIVAWYYQYGTAVLLLVVLPHATRREQWQFNRDDGIALAVGIFLWPAAARLLAFANDCTSPVVVMAFAPLQIALVAAWGWVHAGAAPAAHEMSGAVAVVVGLALFVAAVCSQRGAGEGTAEEADAKAGRGVANRCESEGRRCADSAVGVPGAVDCSAGALPNTNTDEIGGHRASASRPLLPHNS